MRPSEKQNVRRHLGHLHLVAKGGRDRDLILSAPTPNLTRAYASVVKHAHEKGRLPKIPAHHVAKVKKLVSPTAAIKTKQSILSGQRGRGFFSSLAKAAIPVVADALLP